MTIYNVIWNAMVKEKVAKIHDHFKEKCNNTFSIPGISSKSLFEILMMPAGGVDEDKEGVFATVCNDVRKDILKDITTTLNIYRFYNQIGISEKTAVIRSLIDVKKKDNDLFESVMADEILSNKDLEKFSVYCKPSSLLMLKQYVVWKGHKSIEKYDGLQAVTSPVVVAFKVLYGITDKEEMGRMHRYCSRSFVCPPTMLNTAFYIKGQDIIDYCKK